MTVRSRQSWKLDNQGQYSRQIGWKVSRGGKRVQHKFRLGVDLKEAKRRELKLIELWEQVEKIAHGKPPLWDEISLEIGSQIARGQYPVVLSPFAGEAAEPYARRIRRSQAQFPMIPTTVGEPALYEQGKVLIEAADSAGRTVLLWEEEMPDWSKLPVVTLQLPRRTGPLESQTSTITTLHQAMRDYIAWIKQTYFSEHLGRITANGYTKIKQMGILLERHQDVPLSAVGYNEVEAMFLLWRKRPFKKGTQTPISRMSASNLIGEMQRFFRWLHRSPGHSWRKPEDFDDIEMAVDTIPQDHAKFGRQVKVFTLDELVLLNQYATPLERVFLLLGLNCGFGIAEVASLQIGEVHLRQPNDGQPGPAVTSGNSFIKRVRRKNNVYGEFILFSQTVQAIQWALERCAKNGEMDSASPLLLNERGQAYDKPTAAGNANQQIPNRFRDLIERVKADDKQIRTLSFNKLRKTAGDLIRRFADGETAGIFLCHGQPVESDELLDDYTNRPFEKVFEGIRRVEEFLQPVFTAAGSEPFKAGSQVRARRQKLERAVDLSKDSQSKKDLTL